MTNRCHFVNLYSISSLSQSTFRLQAIFTEAYLLQNKYIPMTQKQHFHPTKISN